MSDRPDHGRTGLNSLPRPVLVLCVLIALALIAAPAVWPAAADSIQVLIDVIAIGTASALATGHHRSRD